MCVGGDELRLDHPARTLDTEAAGGAEDLHDAVRRLQCRAGLNEARIGLRQPEVPKPGQHRQRIERADRAHHRSRRYTIDDGGEDRRALDMSLEADNRLVQGHDRDDPCHREAGGGADDDAARRVSRLQWSRQDQRSHDAADETRNELQDERTDQRAHQARDRYPRRFRPAGEELWADLGASVRAGHEPTNGQSLRREAAPETRHCSKRKPRQDDDVRGVHLSKLAHFLRNP